MSREIPMDRPLSAEDRQYLLERGNEQQVEFLDTVHGGQPSEEEQRELDTPSNEGPSMPEFQDPSLAAAQQRAAEESDDESDYEDDDDGPESDQYDEMNKAALKAEVERRNREDGANLAVSGTADELRDRLRAADAEA